MKILVLGGTVFLGRHIVEAALARGHEVTLFNRGQTEPHLFGSNVERLVGDRSAELSALADRTWDACIDPSGYLPAHVAASATVLADAVEQYTFISSISVYPRFTRDMDESGALATLPGDVNPDVYENAHYGALKVLCEHAAESAMPGRVLQVRSGLIVGPHDPTHRFTYWPVRVSQGGPILAPVGPEFPIQFIDARDQANWILDAVADRLAGIFNVSGPAGRYSLGSLIDAASRVTGVDPDIRWADEAWLLAREVAPWSDLPLWLPARAQAMCEVSVDKAGAAGLDTRPIDDTVADTLAWFQAQPAREWPAGLTRERESELLSALPENKT